MHQNCSTPWEPIPHANGAPYGPADGTTVIPVTKTRGGALGVFVVKDGEAKFEPAVDATRIALMGILIGLVSASLAGAAMVRRPPWPIYTAKSRDGLSPNRRRQFCRGRSSATNRSMKSALRLGPACRMTNLLSPASR